MRPDGGRGGECRHRPGRRIESPQAVKHRRAQQPGEPSTHLGRARRARGSRDGSGAAHRALGRRPGALQAGVVVLRRTVAYKQSEGHRQQAALCCLMPPRSGDRRSKLDTGHLRVTPAGKAGGVERRRTSRSTLRRAGKVHCRGVRGKYATPRIKSRWGAVQGHHPHTLSTWARLRRAAQSRMIVPACC